MLRITRSAGRHLVAICMVAVTCSLGAQQQAQSDPFAALAAMPASPPVTTGAGVAVLGDDGKPQRDAVLVFVPWSWNGERAMRWDAAMRRHPGDQLASAADFAQGGTRYRLDELASTRVPTDSGLLFVQQGGKFAMAMRLATGATPPRLVLRLQAPRTLPVLVRLPNGDAAPHVDVVLRNGDRLGPVLRARTGSDGRCTLRALPDANAEVALQVTARRALQAPWPANDGELAFALPPTTRLRAQLLGDVCPGAATEWTLSCLDAPPADVVQIVFPTLANEAGTQHAEWFHAEVGSRVRVQAIVDGLPAPPVDVVVAAAQAQEVAVPRVPDRGLIALRALDGGGKPAPGRLLHCRWVDASGEPVAMRATNADGWIELAVPPGAPANCELMLRLHTTGDFDSMVADQGSVRIDTTNKGRQNLGDVRLTALPMALRLQLVDGKGEPVPNITLAMFGEHAIASTSDAAGIARFTAPDPIPPTLQVGIHAPWFFADGDPRERELPTGDAVQRLVVQPAARLRFAAPGLTADLRCDFEWWFEPAEAGREPVPVDVPLGGGDVFMPPGHWHFVVRHGADELLRVEDLRGQAGIELHDPRCMALAWESFARLVTVRLQHADGTPADDAYLCVEAGDTTTCDVARQGRIQMLLPKAGARARVEPLDPRFLPFELGVLDGDRVVRLGGGPRLRCVLSAPIELPPGVQLAVAVGEEHAGLPFDGERNAVLELHEPGPLRAMLVLRRGHRTWRPDASAAIVDVPAAGATHVFVVDDALRQAIARGAKEL